MSTPSCSPPRTGIPSNTSFRSKKNLTGGRKLEGRLDAAESLAWLLDFVFAAHDRVRPFNKWLRWEVENYPLDEPWRESLLTRIEAVLSIGELAAQRSIFHDVEALARTRGLQNVVESWGPDVAFLRR